MGDPSANVFTPRVGCCNYSKAPQCLPVLLVCQAVISQHCSASCRQACYSTPWRLVLHFVSSNLHYSVQTCMTDTFLIIVILFQEHFCFPVRCPVLPCPLAPLLAQDPGQLLEGDGNVDNPPSAVVHYVPPIGVQGVHSTLGGPN